MASHEGRRWVGGWVGVSICYIGAPRGVLVARLWPVAYPWRHGGNGSVYLQGIPLPLGLIVQLHLHPLNHKFLCVDGSQACMSVRDHGWQDEEIQRSRCLAFLFGVDGWITSIVFTVQIVQLFGCYSALSDVWASFQFRNTDIHQPDRT